ncbi:oligosaccharide flippase family protein [Methylobacterium sp. J-076]|uniref:oligosaccharide flippase family protein n=1 Tax=Methylobacterium sp. J-076 TaxID=2836655 RepID=UPI001FB96BD5|nr:oligosaccharide flippase family protein [Methylobacterium sp. J-076]MCJ2012621.1 oligosaccharide flippase family protein [Methylobacterium sp. J-076]
MIHPAWPDRPGYPRGGDAPLQNLETAIARVEGEFLLRESQLAVAQGPVSITQDLAPEAAVAAGPEPDTGPAGHPPVRTKTFLRNIGAGSTVSLVKIAIQLALLPVMAHLLGPREFGIYALAIPVVAFLAVIADGGVGLSLARDQTNSPVIWSTAFWVLMASGIGLSLTVAGSGYVLALISSEPQLKTIMLILAVSFPFLTLSVLPVARLIRSGNLVSCSIADLISVVTSALCAVGLGLLGFGAKSLAFQYMTGYVIRAIILNCYAFERPQAVFRPSAIRSHLTSGGILMGGRVADLGLRFGENLLFGNAFGPATLGAYNFANQVPRFLFEAFSNPSWSALYAQTLGEERERLLTLYYKVCRFMAFVTFPMAAVLAAASADVMAQVLDPKWLEAGVFLRLLAPGYAIAATASMGTALLLALNANKTFFATTIILGAGRVAAVASGHFLPAWQAVSLVTLSNVVFAASVFVFARRFAGARLRAVAQDLAGPFFASVFSGVVCWSILNFTGNSIPALSAAIATAAASYVVAMFAIDGRNLGSELAFLKGAMGDIVKKRG